MRELATAELLSVSGGENIPDGSTMVVTDINGNGTQDVATFYDPSGNYIGTVSNNEYEEAYNSGSQSSFFACLEVSFLGGGGVCYTTADMDIYIVGGGYTPGDMLDGTIGWTNDVAGYFEGLSYGYDFVLGTGSNGQGAYAYYLSTTPGAWATYGMDGSTVVNSAWNAATNMVDEAYWQFFGLWDEASAAMVDYMYQDYYWNDYYYNLMNGGGS